MKVRDPRWIGNPSIRHLRCREIYNIDNFLEALQAESDISQRQWMYRGVGNITHSLRPKIGRFGTRKKFGPRVKIGRRWTRKAQNDSYSLSAGMGLLNEFQRRALPYVTTPPRSQIEWIALAQHHGIPTRLLDWTFSPLTAFYFAVEHGLPQDSGVYAIPRIETQLSENERENVFELDQHVLLVPSHLSARIVAQQSAFVIHPEPQSIFIPNNGHFYLIKGNCIWRIRELLNRWGLSRETLFPGLDGIADNVTWLHKWSSTFGMWS